MQKIQPTREMLSLFGMAGSQQALKQNSKSHSLAISLISAFLIVIGLSVILKISTLGLSVNTTVSAASATAVTQEEPVAFIPGQFVSSKISQGYLGSYR